MGNFVVSLTAILPIFISIFLGYVLRCKSMLDSTTLKQMDRMVFSLFLPLLIFNNIYNTDISTGFSLNLPLYAIVSISIEVILLFIFIPIIEKENKKRGVLIQAIFRSNFVILGLPIAMSLTEKESWGITSILIATIIPFYNILAVITLEVFRGNKINIIGILKGIVKNPLIISSCIGIIIVLSGIKLPLIITDFISSLAQTATPLALILLGASFKFSELKSNLKQISIGVIGRLLVVPAIFIPISVLLGFRNAELVSLMCMFCSPCSVSSFTMAHQMEADGKLAGQIVVVGSALSLFTIFMWTFALKQLGLF